MVSVVANVKTFYAQLPRKSRNYGTDVSITRVTKREIIWTSHPSESIDTRGSIPDNLYNSAERERGSPNRVVITNIYSIGNNNNNNNTVGSVVYKRTSSWSLPIITY